MQLLIRKFGRFETYKYSDESKPYYMTSFESANSTYQCVGLRGNCQTQARLNAIKLIKRTADVLFEKVRNIEKIKAVYQKYKNLRLDEIEDIAKVKEIYSASTDKKTTYFKILGITKRGNLKINGGFIKKSNFYKYYAKEH